MALTAIRALRPGEAIPDGVPRRFLSQHGYVRLRWLVGPKSYVEIYEHRAVMGNPAGMDIHHKNHIKTDNRPENLEVISRSKHSQRHNPMTWDADEAAGLYRAGWSLPRLSRRYGKNTGNINRALVERGVEMRPVGSWRLKPVDAVRVRELHLAGYRAPKIAALVGCTVDPVRRVIRELSLPPHRAGRAPGFELAPHMAERD